jgi:hypothetical protein
MATLIKKPVAALPTFNIGDTIAFNTSYCDGRSYETTRHEATVIKVNRVNLIVETTDGYTHKLPKTYVTFIR